MCKFTPMSDVPYCRFTIHNNEYPMRIARVWNELNLILVQRPRLEEEAALCW